MLSPLTGRARISVKQLRRLLCRSSVKTLNAVPCWLAGKSRPVTKTPGGAFTARTARPGTS
ncbi:hypothetical protein BLAT2472_40515 [Burkholderia latens]